MRTPNGYEMKSTFFMDFVIAEKFGISAVQDTYTRAFEEWKTEPDYLCELILTLNWRLWDTYKENEDLGRLYEKLYFETENLFWEQYENNEEAARLHFEILD